MLRESFTYLFEEEDFVRKLIIGSLLVIGSFLIVPLFILLGYLTSAVQNSVQDQSLPEFTNFLDMFVDGIKLTAVFLVYIIGLLILMLATVTVGEVNEIAGTAIFLLTAVYYFGLFLITPSIVYSFSLRKNLKDGLEVRRIVDNALDLQYVKVLILLVLVSIGFSILQVILAVTIIGLVLVPVTAFYELTIYAKLISRIK